MAQARAAYTEQVRRKALDRGFVMLRVTAEGPHDYQAAGWHYAGDEPGLFMLRDESTAIEWFPAGASLAEIEDYLAGPFAEQ